MTKPSLMTIFIWSDGDEIEHMRRVRVVLDRLRAKGVQLSPKKIKLGMHKLELLGHVVSADGVEPMWDKVEAIVNLPRPITSPKFALSLVWPPITVGFWTITHM